MKTPPSPAEEERLKALSRCAILEAELRRTLDELQRVKEELSWKTAFLEAEANASIDGIIVVDQQGRKILQNQRTTDLFKIPRHIADDKDDGKQVQWVRDMTKNPGQFMEKVARLYAHPDETSRDEIELKDGTMLDRHSAPVVGKDGEYYGRIWTFRDITERKQLEESLRLLGSAVQQSKESIVITDAELDLPGPKILFVNPAFTAMTGYTAEDAIGKTPRMLQGPLTDKTVLSRLRRNLESGEAFAGEAINYRKDGVPFNLEWQVAPIRDASGKVTHFVAIQHDITARKETENALRESNGKFQQLVDNITDAFWIRSPDLSEIHYVSPAFERIWGRSVASLYAQPLAWVDFILPEDRQRVVGAFAALQGDSRTLDIEYRIVRPDGEVRWVRVRGFQVRDAADKLIRHTGIVTDITKMKQTEASLVETSGLLLALLENTNDLIYFKDRESRFVQFSREMLNRFHLTRPDELKGRTDFDFFSEEHARPAFAAEQEIIRTGKAALNLEEKETHLDGRVTWALTSKMPRRDAAGIVIGTMGISRDITERKCAEMALRESEERLRSLIENARDGIFTIAADGTFTSLNPAVAAISGIIRAEWIGKSFAPLLHPDDVPLAREMFECVLQGGQAPVHELRGNPGLNRPALVEVTLTAQKNQAGKTIGVLGIGRDITDRKRLEARLFQSQKLETVGKLAGGIAHEFNSILTAIIGQSELLLADLPAGGSLARSVGEISKAALRAAVLTRQLLAYGRKQMLQPEALDLNRILAGMDSMLRHLMAGDAVDVRIVPTAALRLVKADTGQIEQVIINLAMNAHDAMPNGGKLTLETANVSFDLDSVGRYPDLKPGEYVMLAISDTGKGMTETVKARAFEPFFTTKGVGQGTGLGLSTCYGIIKQSGGHIGVYSEPGQGTTFKIYLPQVSESAKPTVQPLEAPDLPRGTETVLLVEDDPALREMAATLLRRLGYTVLAAANGVEALSLCHERGTGRIDMLFTDVVMPHMSGKELADRMRALYPHTRILFTSAYTETAIVHQGVLDQGVALLQKPYSPSALAQSLRAGLDQGPMNP
jgi:PAS domain S-box-containing protein